MKSLVLLVLIFAANCSLACSCAPNSPVGNTGVALAAAEMVFLGTVKSVVDVKQGKETFREATFEVEETFKGAADRSIKLRTELHMCGSHFEVGQKYLQYGYRDPKRNNVCNGSSVAASAGLALNKLRFLKSEEKVKSKKDCEVQHGRWEEQFKMAHGFKCFLPTPDRDQRCHDSSECISVCTTDVAAEKFARKGTCLGKLKGKICTSVSDCANEVCEISFDPIKGSGQCYGWTKLTGTCLSHVHAGWIGSPLCID